ncbi:MAG: 4'-phosphopantetheinyl transferase superfamily protein [Catenulispora sp.]|nr:4'-phosphopantetheinyl transferase superfamily protein [Catenulispora sp.]
MSGAAGCVVRAWLVDDQVSQSCVAELFGVLDAGERRRADRRDTADGRRRFVVAHGAVRRIVGEHLGAPPGELVWRIGPDGKPELDGPWTGVRVNLSHSGGLCLIALCDTREVGVDVQRHVPGVDVVAMARRYFPADEAASVAAADDPVDAFARLWARKEAVSKAAGGRLMPVLRVPVESVASDYRVVDLSVSAGFRAAVALAGAEPFTVEMAEWRP